MAGPSSDDHHYADAKDGSDAEMDDGYLEPYEHLVKENIKPAYYDDLTKKSEPTNYEELRKEKRHPEIGDYTGND